jgi:hypothetical protein
VVVDVFGDARDERDTTTTTTTFTTVIALTERHTNRSLEST